MIIPNPVVQSESNQAVRHILQGNKQAPRISPIFMQQFVAGAAKGNQVFGIVGASGSARDDMVNFQKAGVTTALAAAMMAIAGQDFTANPWGDGGLVALAGFVDLRVFPGGFKIGFG